MINIYCRPSSYSNYIFQGKAREFEKNKERLGEVMEFSEHKSSVQISV